MVERKSNVELATLGCFRREVAAILKEMVAMITCHVIANLMFDWLIGCFGPGYQF